MKRFIHSTLLVFIAYAVLSLTNSAYASNQTLYQRLGGYDAIALVVDDLMSRLAKDEQVGRMLVHIPDTRFVHVRQLMVDFICATTGGPCHYNGKTMFEAHKGMGLTESDWAKTVEHLKQTLNHFKVNKKEQEEMLTTLSSLKSSIVDS